LRTIAQGLTALGERTSILRGDIRFAGFFASPTTFIASNTLLGYEWFRSTAGHERR